MSDPRPPIEGMDRLPTPLSVAYGAGVGFVELALVFIAGPALLPSVLDERSVHRACAVLAALVVTGTFVVALARRRWGFAAGVGLTVVAALCFAVGAC